MKKCITIALLSLLPVICFASNHNVYVKPDTNSPVIATINEHSHIIPIYQQGDWVEIGSQQTGQVGWINTQEVQHNEPAIQQAELGKIKAQRQQLLEAKERFQASYNEAMRQLDQKQEDMMQTMQENAVPAQLILPVAHISQHENHHYTMHSKSVTLKCHDDKGVQTVTESWTDKNGHEHTKHYSQKIDCSQDD
jgi:hypothetical protein